MKQILALLLPRDKSLERIRSRFLPSTERIDPHITLVYPFEFTDPEKLHTHITETIQAFKSFPLSLHGLEKSAKGYYLYLLVDKEKEDIVRLHDALQSGVLKDCTNSDMPIYIPHLSLGVFESEEEQEKAIQELSSLNLTFETSITSLQLLSLEGDTVVQRQDFIL